MLTLARQWCALLGINPDTAPYPPATPPAGGVGRVAAGVATVLARIHPAAADDTAGPPDRHHHDDTGDLPATWTSRPPSADERYAAARLGTLLRQARSRERVSTVESAAIPPGRLRTRPALTAAAQHAAGAVVTAQPWQRTTRRTVPDPDLAVAVLVDVSGSMYAFAKPLSAAAWILAHAAARAGATTATVAFGDRVTVLVPPGRPPSQVRDMRADAGAEEFDRAVAVADRLLHLSTPGTVRLLVVVSDGRFADPAAAQRTITTLRATGCGILWLAPAGTSTHIYGDTTTISVDNPATCTVLIGRAATDALAHA
jgi:uncharacterized protein with von Willebrand factor type A (vWA) domain